MQLTSSHEHIQNNPRRPYIHLRATILHGMNFRRDIRRGSTGSRERPLLSFMSKHRRESEIRDLEVSTRVEKNVFWFEITMADASVV